MILDFDVSTSVNRSVFAMGIISMQAGIKNLSEF
jgi:hypothetical protein